MSRHWISISAVFRQRHHPVFLRCDRKPPSVVVYAVHIPALLVKPAAGLIDQPRSVQSAQLLRDPGGIKLPPSFVKRNPHGIARMIIQLFYHPRQITAVLSPARRILPLESPVIAVGHFSGYAVGEVRDSCHKNHIVGTAPVRHILPHKHTQSVTVIIESLRFHFHVFADRIVTQFFLLPDVIEKRLVCRRRHQALRPVPLIQQSVKKVWSVIQEKSQDAVSISAGRNLSHAEIRSDLVITHCDFHIIQKGIFRRP